MRLLRGGLSSLSSIAPPWVRAVFPICTRLLTCDSLGQQVGQPPAPGPREARAKGAGPTLSTAGARELRVSSDPCLMQVECRAGVVFLFYCLLPAVPFFSLSRRPARSSLRFAWPATAGKVGLGSLRRTSLLLLSRGSLSQMLRMFAHHLLKLAMVLKNY